MSNRQDFNKTMVFSPHNSRIQHEQDDFNVTQTLDKMRPETPTSAHNTLSAMQQQLLNETLRVGGGPGFLTFLDNMKDHMILV